MVFHGCYSYLTVHFLELCLILKITTGTTETVLYEFIDEVINNEDKLAETIT